MKSTVMTTSAAMVFAVLAMPATAERVEEVSIAVDISKHDVATNDGARDAVQDIYKAAKEVCDVDRPTVDPRHHIKARDCVESAMERAISVSGHNTLASAYARVDLQ